MAQKLDTQIRREQIAEAALALVAEAGPRALNLAEVARRVDMVPSALYRHYPGKEAILDAVMDLVSKRLQANLLLVREETDHALERLELLLKRHVRMLNQYRAIPMLIFSDHVYGGNPEQRSQATGLIESYAGAIERMVREGQVRGQINHKRHPESVAALFLGILQPAAIIASIKGNTFNLDQHVREAWAMIRPALIPVQETVKK